MPKRNCPSCLSAVSVQITKCPYCGATVPSETVTGPQPAVAAPARRDPVPTPPRDAINFRAVLLGVGVCLLGIVIGGFVLGIVFSKMTASAVTGPGGVTTDVPLLAAALVVGLGFTVFGAHAGARRARQRELLHAGIIGAIMTVGSLLALLMPGQFGPTWFILTSAALSMPAALLGGQLSRRGR